MVHFFNNPLVYKVFAPIAFAIFITHWLIPMYMIHAVQQWYGKQGVNYQLEIGSWWFSPANGSVAFEDLIFNHGDASSQFGHAEVNISMLSLFQKILEVESINLLDGKIRVVQSGETLSVLGVTIDGGEHTQSEYKDVNTKDGWDYEVGKVHIKNQEIAFINNSDNFKFSINEFSINAISNQEYSNVEAEITLTNLEMFNSTISLLSPVRVSLNGLLEAPFSDPTFKGSATIKDFNLETPWLPTGRFDALNINDMSLNMEKQSFGRVKLNNLYVDDELFSLQEYLINDIQVIGNTITTGLHEWQGLESQLIISTENKVQQMKLRESYSKEKKSGISEANNENKEKITWRIDGIHQSPEDESRILIKANHLKPMLEVPIVLKNVNLNNLNMEGDLIHFHAEASTDEYSRLIVDGDASHDLNNGHIDIDLAQFDLVSLNGLVNEVIGYHVEKGQLNLIADVNITSGKLSGSTDVFVRNNNMVPSDEQAMDRISQKISMPIETALSLIKDDDNNIKLNIPIEGDIHSPDFGMNDLVLKLSKTALQSATLHYIQLALFPYGLALDIAGYLGNQIFSIRLMPMVVESEELNTEQQAYAEKIAQMMLEKQVLQLHLCPIADHEAAKHEEWQNLVKKQANIIKRHIVAQDIQLTSRVLICQPRIGDKTQILMGF